MQARKNSRLPDSFSPALVSGVADAHQITSPFPNLYFTTSRLPSSPYSGKANDSGFQYACGARVICGAACVMTEGDSALTFFHVIPDKGSGTIPFSGRKYPTKGPVAMMCPPKLSETDKQLWRHRSLRNTS